MFGGGGVGEELEVERRWTIDSDNDHEACDSRLSKKF